MTRLEIHHALLNLGFGRLCDLCKEFELWGVGKEHQYILVNRLIKWCDTQGQDLHLAARVTELRG